MRNKILITGGFGYLGGRIALHLARESGFNIILASRKVKSPPVWLPEAETISFDLIDSDSMINKMNEVEVVIHLAAMNENECMINPTMASLVNSFGTQNLIKQSICAGVKKFIYFSTAHVYGTPLTGHITEKTKPNPIHPYAISHFDAEKYVLTANKQKKINGIVIRLSNGFGVPAHAEVDRWSLLVNDLCRQLVENNKIVLRTSGIQKRDFITIEDISRAVSHLIKLPSTDCIDGLFNLGSQTRTYSILELVHKVANSCKKILNFYPEIIKPEPQKNDICNDFIFDSTKLKHTGFSCIGNLESEIENTLLMATKYFKCNE